jgi:hypothetical protein
VTTDRFVVTPRVFDVDKDTLCVPIVSDVFDADETGVNELLVDFDT